MSLGIGSKLVIDHMSPQQSAQVNQTIKEYAEARLKQEKLEQIENKVKSILGPQADIRSLSLQNCLNLINQDQEIQKAISYISKIQSVKIPNTEKIRSDADIQMAFAQNLNRLNKEGKSLNQEIQVLKQNVQKIGLNLNSLVKK